jgi:D-alanine-D-alanine ligase
MASSSNTAGVPVRTLGPISDLERHLPPDWWRGLFNSLYLKTDGDVVENDANTAAEIDLLISAAGLEPNDQVLDLCCGQGRHALALAGRGFSRVTGLDRSRYLVRLARKRARELGLEVTFREGDARQVRLGDGVFHCVALMGNSFGYFEREEDDRAVLRAIQRVLVSGGTVAMDLVDGDWMREHFEPRSWEWIDQNHLVCRERSLDSRGDRLISREVIIHAERGVIADQFYAERLYNEEKIAELLDSVGFDAIRFHGQLHAASTREQDLGMMAHRFFLTAQAPRKAVAVSRRGPAWPKVTVLMGDPTLPDTVKRGGQFNPEDFETIRRLKSALGELGEYCFDFLDHHVNLLRDLRENRPDFVLNLCDEGFNNNAFLELHVPAILEMMDIPYSGAGPACLGLCYNKALVRGIAQSLEIPVPAETYFDPSDQAATLPAVFPALVKPCCGDSSIGITSGAVVNDSAQLLSYLDKVQQQWPGRPLLVQEFLCGAEYSVGLIGNVGLSMRALPVLEVDYSRLAPTLPKLLGYESKWMPDSPYWNDIAYHEATLPDAKRQELVDYSMLLFDRLGCRDYARFDWRADAQGTIKLLEVNPNPGWCWDGKHNYMAGFAGLRYAEMLRLILESAQQRYANGCKDASAAASGTYQAEQKTAAPAG